MSIAYLRCARDGLFLVIGAVLVASCGGGGGGPPAKYTIGATVTGLAGSGLVLQDNGSDNLAIAANGNHTFATSLESGSAYAVSIKSQPSSPLQTCAVANAAGVVSGANVANVTVTCKTNTYTVGGAVSGLTGSGLVLQDNGGNDLAIAANGSFTFSTAVASGAAYATTIETQPTSPSQTCVVANAAGTVAAANVANVAVTCTTNSYTVGGSVSGLVGSGLVLQDNGGNNLAVAANGSFTFSTAVASGAAYAATIATQPTSPSQTCVVANAAGKVAAANVANVAVTCTTNTYSVGGLVGGLVGSGLVLQDNGGNNLNVAANGSFTFSTPIASGAAYAATIVTQPTSPSQTCVIANAVGTVTAATIANIAVTCTTKPGRFAYVSGHTAIYCYALNAVTGGLAALASSPCDSGVLTGVAVDPSGRFAYATLSASNQIRAYTISDSTGSLSPIAGSQLNGGGSDPVDVVVDPLGQFVYMANYDGSISAFTMDSVSGGLAAVPGSPFPTAPAISGQVPGASSVTVDPSGKFLYAAVSQGNCISAYLINSSTGALTPISGSPFTGVDEPQTVRVDPSGRYAYVTNAFSDNISVYSINSSTGALTPIAGSPFSSGGSYPAGLAIDPAGAYVFVTNSSSDSVSVFALDSSTGGLTPVPGSPFAGGANPVGLSVHPSGKFLYESDNGAGTVSAYAIDSANGSLTPIAGSPFAASGSGSSGTYSIAISD